MASWVGPLLILLGAFLCGLALGIPMAFVLGGGALLTGYVFYSPSILRIAMTNTMSQLHDAGCSYVRSDGVHIGKIRYSKRVV